MNLIDRPKSPRPTSNDQGAEPDKPSRALFLLWRFVLPRGTVILRMYRT